MRADGRYALYVCVIYFLMHAERDGVYIKIINEEAEKPESSQALGNAYFAYETSISVCEGGKFTGVAGQRTATKVTRGCLIQLARHIMYQFVNDKDAGPNVLVPVAETIRLMILDKDFDWHASTSVEHVGNKTSCPCAWRLLLPRFETQRKANKAVQTATTGEMDMLDAVAGESVEPMDVGEGLNWGDDDFGIMPMAGL